MKRKSCSFPAEVCEEQCKRQKKGAIRAIRIGSDCTGLNAARLAFEELDLNVVETFASDVDAACRAVLEENYTIQKIFSDVAERRGD
eukprot:5291999-Amphidinium_carterae.1